MIEVSGLIDPVTAQFIGESIDAAVDKGAEVLIIQLDSGASLLSEEKLAALEQRIRGEQRIPIAVWVGPSRARAKRGAVRILRAASIVGVAPGTHIGHSTAPSDGSKDPLELRTLNDRQALADGVAQLNAPVLGQFVIGLDGRTVAGKVLDTAKPLVNKAGKKTLQPYGVRFAKLGALPRLLHTVTNPTVAYLLLIIALALMVFEFYTGGIGVAAFVAVGCFVLSSYGFGLLPTRPLALGLLALAAIGYAIDVQAGSPRFWTGVGVVAMALGSLTLYRGNGIAVPRYWIALMSVLLLVFMVNGMPGMVRTRFSTPTIGRESMIGEIGEAREAVDPDGVVTVRDAPWRARTNRATPIPAGDPIRVVAIDGLLLEVEPLAGAAKDAGH